MNQLNELRAKARAIIAAYKQGDVFDKAVEQLSAIGYAIEDALATA